MFTFCFPVITINSNSILCHTDFCGDSVLNVKNFHIACAIQNIRSSHAQAARKDTAGLGQGGGYDVILQLYRGVFDCSVCHVASWVTNTSLSFDPNISGHQLTAGRLIFQCHPAFCLRYLDTGNALC